MKKLLFLIPHSFWLLIAIIFVEAGFFTDIIDLSIFLFLSLVIHLFLDMKRNKKHSNLKKLSRARLTAYIISNIILGYFAGMVYLFLIPVIYFMTHPLGYMDSGFTPIEAYLFMCMFIIWVVYKLYHIKG